MANQSGYETGDLILNEDDQTYSLNINPGDYEGFGSGAFTSFDPLWYYVIIRDASTGDIVGAACTKTLEEKI